MEIIEILSPVVADQGAITVNTAVDFVTPTQLTNFKVMQSYSFALGGNLSHFVAGDNFTVLSCGFIIPPELSLYFGTGSALNDPLFILTYNIGGADLPVQQFGSSATMKMFAGNYEMSVGTYINIVSQTKTHNFQLKVALANVNISMLNIPAALNTKVFNIMPFMKILHNSPMYA